MGRWQRYWFSEGGRTALAIVRIAIAASVLLTLARLDDPVSTSTRALYRPVGIWMLLGHTAPPAVLVDLLWVLAWTGTVAMLLGLATRTATAVSFVAAVALAALSFSASRTWSHQYNVVFLAQLALLGARGGDVLSLDWVIRRARGLPSINIPRAYQWSLRLVQLAVALMFAGAVFHKIVHGQFTLRWALSDNLRHHLLMRFDLADLPRPPLVDWLIDDPMRYRTAAVLNLISQALPLAAVFLMKRPLLRAFAGSFFVIETIALGLVVGLWNLHWLPLAAVFIDWDRLIAKIGRRPRWSEPANAGERDPITHPTPAAEWKPRRVIRVWLIAFIIYDVLTAFIPALDQRLNTYPFSGFPMFATVRVRPPYDQHQAYGVAGDYFEVTSDRPIELSIQRWFDHSNRGMHAVRNPDELHRRLAATLANAQRRWPMFGIKGVRLWLTIYQSPAYPAPAHFERHPVAVLGEITPDGTFRTMLGKLTGSLGSSSEAWVEVAPRAVPLTKPTLVYYRDDIPEPIALDASPTEHRFAIGYQRIEGNPLYFVVKNGDTPWLAAVHAPWRWQ